VGAEGFIGARRHPMSHRPHAPAAELKAGDRRLRSRGIQAAGGRIRSSAADAGAGGVPTASMAGWRHEGGGRWGERRRPPWERRKGCEGCGMGGGGNNGGEKKLKEREK
jgi:hypothetical protein